MCVMNKLFGLTVLCLVISFGTMAQNTRSTTAPVTPRPAYQSAKKKQKKGMFAFLKKEKPKNEVADFRDRLQKVYKQKAKEEKKMEKMNVKIKTSTMRGQTRAYICEYTCTCTMSCTCIWIRNTVVTPLSGQSLSGHPPITDNFLWQELHQLCISFKITS